MKRKWLDQNKPSCLREGTVVFRPPEPAAPLAWPGPRGDISSPGPWAAGAEPWGFLERPDFLEGPDNKHTAYLCTCDCARALTWGDEAVCTAITCRGLTSAPRKLVGDRGRQGRSLRAQMPRRYSALLMGLYLRQGSQLEARVRQAVKLCQVLGNLCACGAPSQTA